MGDGIISWKKQEAVTETEDQIVSLTERTPEWLPKPFILSSPFPLPPTNELHLSQLAEPNQAHLETFFSNLEAKL